MLTPTGVTTSAYWDAIKAGNATHVRLTFIGQNIVLDDSDIDISSGLEITDIFNGDTDLVFGKAVAKQVHMGILNSSKLSGLIWTGEFTLEMGVEIGNPLATNWVQIGIFSGEKPNNVTSVNVIDFIAYDRMTKFDILSDEWFRSIEYPASISNIYSSLCSYVGVGKQTGDELAPIMSRTYSAAPFDMSGYTCRDVLAMIAEACGCYAKITALGNVKMCWFSNHTSYAITGNEEFNVESGDINDGMTWEEADEYTWNEIENFSWDDIEGYEEIYSVDYIYMKQLGGNADIYYPSNIGGNAYTIVENPFLTVTEASHINSYIKPLFDRLEYFGGYLPINVDCVGCWLVESGDIITVDAKGENVSTPIFVRTLHWNGSVNDNYEATGNKERSAYASESDKQLVWNDKIIKMTIGDNYYHVQSGITIEPAGVTISGGKYLKLESGGVLDIFSDNFMVSSSAKYMKLYKWTWGVHGFYHTDEDDLADFVIGSEDDMLGFQQANGILFDIVNDGGNKHGKIRFETSRITSGSSSHHGIIMQSFENGSALNVRLYPNGNGFIGSYSQYWQEGHFNELYVYTQLHAMTSRLDQHTDFNNLTETGVYTIYATSFTSHIPSELKNSTEIRVVVLGQGDITQIIYSNNSAMYIRTGKVSYGYIQWYGWYKFVGEQLSS